MRTSHISIQKRIHETISGLTDETFFASSHFAAYLTDLLEAATRRYRRKSRVTTIWDLSEDAPVAYTDNVAVCVNAANKLTMSFPTRALRAESLVGLVGHEGGHILFSNFPMLDYYHRSIRGCRFYPHSPEDLTMNQMDALAEIQKAFEESDQAVIHALEMVSHHVINILEDIYIEAMMCHHFPGTFRIGILLNNYRFIENMESVQTELKRNDHEVSILLNLLIQYARSGDVNNPDGYSGPLMDVLYECIPYVDESVYDDNPKARFDAANHILLILWPHMLSLIEKIREDIKNGKHDADTEMQVQVATGATTPGLTSSAVSGAGILPPPDKSDREADDEMVRKVLEEETLRIPLTKTGEISEGSSGGVSRNYHFEGSDYLEQAREDMNRLMTKLATETVQEACEQELSEELQAEADSIRYGNAHRGIHVHINRMSYVSNAYMTAYREIAQPLILIAKRLVRQVSQLLEDYRNGGRQDHLPMGKRINVRNAVHNDGLLFSRNNLPGDDLGMAVAILNDESGSMAGYDRITHARAASIILHRFCRELNIPVAIYGHTEVEDVEMYAYAEFDSVDDKDQFRMMDMSARSNNRDGAALRFVAERLMKRPEPLKLLIVISDGQPAATGYYGTEAEADMRGIRQEYTRKGILFFAAAIGNDKSNIQRIYGDGFLDITDLNRLPVNLGKVLIQHIRNRIS